MPVGVKKIANIASTSINAEATIFTPTSGKRWVIERMVLTNTGTAASVVLKDGTGGTTVATRYLAANTPAEITFTHPGIRSGAADNVLTATGTSATINGYIEYFEE